MLRDFVAAVQQSRNQEVARVAPAQHSSWLLSGRNQATQIAALLFINRRGFPDFRVRWFGTLCGRPALHDVRIIERAAAGRPISPPRSATASATAGDVTHIENWSLEAIDGERVSIAVSNRAG